jgi:hypothetical protein
MVSILVSSAVDHGGCKSCLGQTKDYKIDICCFYAKHATEWDEENVIIIIFFFFASDSTGDTSFIKIHHFFPYIN